MVFPYHKVTVFSALMNKKKAMKRKKPTLKSRLYLIY